MAVGDKSNSLIDECVDLCGEYKIALREAVDGVRPDADIYAAVRHTEVGMVVFRLSEGGHHVDESHRLHKIFKAEAALKMVVFDYRPIGSDVRGVFCDLLRCKGWYASLAGYALFVFQVHDASTILYNQK